MVTKHDFEEREVKAANSVLVELIHILGEYKDAIVIVGGSVPPLLFPDSANKYVGTLDVDIAIDHKLIDDDTYQTIRKALMNKGYQENDKQPFIFYRSVSVPGGEQIVVQVDILSGEYGGTGKSHRTQKVQDIRARKARGSDLAFEMYKEVEIEAELPEGGIDKVRFRIAAVVPFIVMKGMALNERLKEKDAWDIYYCLINHPGHIDGIIEEFRDFLENKLVEEGLRKIKAKFASPDHIGPKCVADFEEISDKDERDRIQRDAYERVNYLIEKLGI
jgi:hypothetical protein